MRRPLPPDNTAQALLASTSTPRWRLIYVLIYLALGLFALLALLTWTPHPGMQALVLQALTGYAALLVSFTGGLHWGVGLRYLATTSRVPAFHFVWGPLPALLAWGAMLLPAHLGLLLMAAVYALAHLVDVRVWPGSGLAPWVPLRQQFTVGAMACCVLGAVATPW
ncbi:MAG: DUF3429 domain-containing protein [Pseudomonadota bacterium]|nr:DUF3429 domain-containing protein [Pseudomonadota bacterium]